MADSEADVEVVEADSKADQREAETSQGLSWDSGAGPQPFGFGFDAEPVLVDWFGRGVQDLLVTDRPIGDQRRTRVYPSSVEPGQTGALAFEAGREVPELTGLRCLCPLPNGRESRFDLIGLSPVSWVHVPNRGSASHPDWGPPQRMEHPEAPALATGRILQAVAVDWDGDGRHDLLVGYQDLTGYWPWPDRPVHQQLGWNEDAAHPGYDRQGRWRGRAPQARALWARNLGETGAPRFAAFEPIDIEGVLDASGTRLAPLLLAWGPARAWEVALADERGQLRVYRNFGGQRPPVLMEPQELRDVEGRPITLPNDLSTLSATDLDGDGREELVFGAADGRIFGIRSGSKRDAGALFGPLRQQSDVVRLGGGAVLTAGDLDGDGGLDLVYGDAPGRLYVLMDRGGPGGHRYEAPARLESGGDPIRVDPGLDGRPRGPIDPPLGFAAPLLIDWKNNGRLDLIVTGAGGEVLFLRNNGHETQPRFDFAEPIRQGSQPLVLPPRVRPAAVDWNGEGLPDLIAPDLNGILCCWPRVETLMVGEPEPLTDPLGRPITLDGAFGLAGRCALWAGDWTGSGRPDLLVGLPFDARFVVPALSGEPLERLEDVPNALVLEQLEDGTLLPWPLRFADGRPVLAPADGCSPIGVDWTGAGRLDLLVGSTEGSVTLISRDRLQATGGDSSRDRESAP